jgi:glycerol uptake facilitator-like aquaporin
MFGRQKIAMLVAEFLGTATLTAAVYAMAVRTSFPFFSAAAAAVTIGLMVILVGKASGAHINPAVTLGLWTMRKIDTAKAVVYIAAQLLGAVAAWRLMEYLMDSPLKDIAGKNVDWRVMVAEGVGALLFGWAVAAVVDRGLEGAEKAGVLGTAFFISVLVASFASNGVVNPAVAVGVQSWNVSYIVAPLVGAIVGMNIYGYVFAGLDNKRAVVASTRKSTAKKTTKRKR